MKTEGNRTEKPVPPVSKEEKKPKAENAPQKERNAANGRTQNQHGGQENRQNSYNRGGNGNNKNTGRDGGNNRGNRNDRRDGNKDNRQGRGYNNRDNRDNSNRDNSGSRQGSYANRNGKPGGFDSRRNTQAPMETMKPEVKQSRQQRANKDSRSAKQRHGKDRGREEFEEDAFNQNNNKARKKKDPNRKGAFIRPEPVAKPQEPEDGIRNIILPEKMTIKELADIMKVPAATVIKKLFLQGNVVSLNHEITYEEAEEIALEYNCIAEMEEKVDKIAELLKEDEEDEKLMKKRPPVVCVMGHVDHGKTSLLDAI